MKNIIHRSYTCLLYIFFASFMLLIRMDANEMKNFFCIGLILGSLILSFVPFLVNRCKKIQIRRWYLASFLCLNFFVLLQAIYLLLLDNVFINNYQNYEFENNLWVWILRLSQAFFITTFLFTLIFTLKDFFKKDYVFQRFDLETIQMVINLLAYILIIYVVFDYSGYYIRESMNSIDFKPNGDYILCFGNYSLVLNGIGIISLAYITSYITIELIKYYNFDKKEDSSKNVFK